MWHVPAYGINQGQRVLEVDARGSLHMALYELQQHIHVADTDAFLSALLHVEQDIVDSIYDTLVQDGYYDQVNAVRVWRSFPTSECTEHALNVPFTTAANAINDACAALTEPSVAVNIKSSWRDCHSTPLKSRDLDAPDIHPEAVCLLGARNDTDVLKEKSGGEEEVGGQVRRISENMTFMLMSASPAGWQVGCNGWRRCAGTSLVASRPHSRRNQVDARRIR